MFQSFEGRKKMKINSLEKFQEFSCFDSLVNNNPEFRQQEPPYFNIEDILLASDQFLSEVKIEHESNQKKIQCTFPLHILQLKKVKELREIVEELKEIHKLHFHWTWIQNKSDIIELILNPTNPVFLEKNPNFQTRRIYKKKRNNSQI